MSEYKGLQLCWVYIYCAKKKKSVDLLFANAQQETMTGSCIAFETIGII